MVEVAPFGAWLSPVSANLVASAAGRPGWVGTHDGQVWWTETRPDEGGRVALLRMVGDRQEELLPGTWNARNRVHEYGGRPWTVAGRHIAFTHWDDQRVYACVPGEAPRPITEEPRVHHGLRYADLVAAPDNDAVWCVRETVTGERPTDVTRALVSVPLAGDGSDVRVLTASHHFMTAPQPSPDGRRAAWLGWNHPDMPWQSTELCVADVLPDGRFGEHAVVAGGPAESVCQFEWDGPETLLALTDPDGWWNLYRIGLDGSRTNLAPVEAELGGPMWTPGQRWFAPLGNGRYVVLRSGRPAVLDERGGTVTDLDADPPMWTEVAGADGVVAAVAAGPFTGQRVVVLDRTGPRAVTAPAVDLPDPEYLPVPRIRTFNGPGGRTVPAVVYPPRNPDFAAPDGELPPYVVHAHGGPTASFAPTLNLPISYLTSRGIGVVAVDYGGSTGYGRAYRDSLAGQWGVVDIEDCALVAAALIGEGTADPARIGIRGGSAGGWTAAASVLAAPVYACATAMFPMLDVTPWADGEPDTHDFESRYIEWLIGALPEHRQRYADRSPMSNVDRLAKPILVLQGLEDQVCPATQAQRFVAQLDGSGVPHAYVGFEGEQHGFRRAETVAAAIEAELSFYGQVFGFPAHGVPVLALRI